MNEETTTEETTTTDTTTEAVDYASLFTPEEVAAKQEAITTAKAEEDRRAALTEEERASEDQAAADAKAAEEQANAGAPEDYADFKIPDGMDMDAELLGEFKPLAKELNLSQDKAQKVIDLYADKIAPAFVKKQAEAWEGQLEAWKTECKTDKEIGGDKFDASVMDAQRVINTIGTPELKKVFDDYGLGNNPEMVRVFARMAKFMKEDDIEGGGKESPKEKSIEGRAARLYNGQ